MKLIGVTRRPLASITPFAFIVAASGLVTVKIHVEVFIKPKLVFRGLHGGEGIRFKACTNITVIETRIITELTIGGFAKAGDCTWKAVVRSRKNQRPYYLRHRYYGLLRTV